VWRHTARRRGAHQDAEVVGEFSIPFAELIALERQRVQRRERVLGQFAVGRAIRREVDDAIEMPLVVGFELGDAGAERLQVPEPRQEQRAQNIPGHARLGVILMGVGRLIA